LRISKKIASGFAALALGLAAVFAGVSPASAHAELVEASPAADSLIGALPEYVDLTFGENIMTIEGSEGSNIITVVDANGAKVDDETIVVDAAVVSVGIKAGFGNGTYTVTYRVVSEDGHPIEGSYKFEVGEAAQTSVIAPAPTASHTDEEHAEESAAANSNTTLIIVAGSVAVAAIASIVLLLRRRKATSSPIE
jgi:methionine-rich copper-binding protein CopC